MRYEHNLSTGEVTEHEDAEVIVIPETVEQVVARLKAELQSIEYAEIMPRKTREIQIQLMEFLAVQQGVPLEQLALNPAYAGMKDVEAQCVALRNQIRELS